MKYLSVCSGIEAATVAWHGLGCEPVAFAEIEPFPAAVLAHHYPAVPNLGDLTKYREWPEELLADVDLLVGGTPCQAFSVAGKRQSLDDERGNLSLVYVNLYHHINEVRARHGRPPAIALWENVPGVLSTKDNAFGCFIGGLLGCDEAPETESGKWDKAGFLSSETVRVGYRVLDAQYFGVAQRRRRVFLAAVPCELVERFGERACPSEILSLRESVLGNPPTRGAAWEGVARATAAGLTSSGRGVERAGESRGQDDVVVAFGGNRSSGPLDVAKSFLASGSPHGLQDFASERFVACFHPTQDPICSCDGSAHSMGTGSRGGCSSHAVCVTGHRTHALTTRAAACEEGGTGRGTPIVPVAGEPQTFDWQASDGGNDTSFRGASRAYVVDKPGCSRALTSCKTLAVATPIDMRQASRGEKVTNNRLEGSGGPPGHGVGDAGDPAFTVSERGQAVAIDLQNVAIGGDIAGTLDTTRPSRGGGQAVAIPISADADRQNSAALTPSPDAEGRIRLRDPGIGIGENGDPVFTMQSTKPHAVAIDLQNVAMGGDICGTLDTTRPSRGGGQAVAFKPSHFTRGKDGAPAEVVSPLSADADKGDQDTVVAFAQNQLGEVRVNADVMGTVNQNQNASGRNTPMVFANRTRDGIKVPEVTKDGVVPALTNPGGGGRSDAVNVATAMQVRRLCPSECEALQGFPIGYTDVTYRKKPAADGPRYRALGNSMAVPCMWWLGYRIHKATH